MTTAVALVTARAARGLDDDMPPLLAAFAAAGARAVIVDRDDPEVREEDYAAAMMAVENLALTAVELGLGTHIKTGGVMSDPAARAAAGVRDGERIVAMVNVGTPADVPPPKARDEAAAFTTWKE